jgi:hypothetical protein
LNVLVNGGNHDDLILTHGLAFFWFCGIIGLLKFISDFLLTPVSLQRNFQRLKRGEKN